MVYNATCNNISFASWRSVLLVEETVVHGENHRFVAGHRQTLSHSGVPVFELKILVVTGTDSTGKSNYHTITTTTAEKI